MANPEHLKILEQGVEVWNKWRHELFSPIDPDLSYANFSDDKLYFVDFNGAILTGANFNKTDLLGTNFRGAELANSNFFGTYLHLVDFTLANLNDANFGRAVLGGTIFGSNDLSKAKMLEEVRHFGESTVGIQTIYASRGQIPESFLRGCGVPEDFITYMRSLTEKAIDFYKCFISFTEADDTFSARLYNDMQGVGIRCWRWKEDAKWGRTLMHSIDEAVRVYDKLIVICSEQSLNSPAVIREIERALQKEDAATREGKEAEVLFPIRLDDYIFTDWQHHRKVDVVAKNVGDFRKWTEPEEYKKALQRLIRDLKAEARREADG